VYLCSVFGRCCKGVQYVSTRVRGPTALPFVDYVLVMEATLTQCPLHRGLGTSDGRSAGVTPGSGLAAPGPVALLYFTCRALHSAAHFFDLGGPSHYSGNYLIGFEHCGAHFFDLGGPSHYSGIYLIGFEHCDPAPHVHVTPTALRLPRPRAGDSAQVAKSPNRT